MLSLTRIYYDKNTKNDRIPDQHLCTFQLATKPYNEAHIRTAQSEQEITASVLSMAFLRF